MSHDTVRLRNASGHVEDERMLVAFLYLLGRDHLPAGRISDLMNEVEQTAGPLPRSFTNGWLARFAQDCADRLTWGQAPSVPTVPPVPPPPDLDLLDG